jgi:hypothetical protein
MRLISRLFTLCVLVTILAFTNLVSSPSKAEDSVCTDTCNSEYDLCIQRCTPGNSTSSGCLTNCAVSSANCKSKCKDKIALEESEY